MVGFGGGCSHERAWLQNSVDQVRNQVGERERERREGGREGGREREREGGREGEREGRVRESNVRASTHPPSWPRLERRKWLWGRRERRGRGRFW